LDNDFTPEETAIGVRAVIAAVEERLPNTKILLLAILPAGEKADNPLRQKILLTNQTLQTLADAGRVELHDVGAALIESDGTIAASTMADFLHPTPEGYARLTEAVAPWVERIMNE
jgi:lysophospholipase L1-like esterase